MERRGGARGRRLVVALTAGAALALGGLAALDATIANPGPTEAEMIVSVETPSFFGGFDGTATGTAAANNTVTFPRTSISFEPIDATFFMADDVYEGTIDLVPTAAWTGKINPSNGEAELAMPAALRIDIPDLDIANCRVDFTANGDIEEDFGYDPASGMVTLIDDSLRIGSLTGTDVNCGDSTDRGDLNDFFELPADNGDAIVTADLTFPNPLVGSTTATAAPTSPPSSATSTSSTTDTPPTTATSSSSTTTSTTFLPTTTASTTTTTTFLPTTTSSTVAPSTSSPPTTGAGASTPVVRVDPVSVVEGTGARGSLVVVVRLDRPAPRPVGVKLMTRDRTAGHPSDYGAVRAQLAFAPGQVEQAVVVKITGDRDFEGDEVFDLELLHEEGVQVAARFVSVTIVDDDA